MIVDLKPCPWCGRVPVAADISGGGPAYWVECYRCEATGPVDTSSSLDGAADAWNRRPVEDALQARTQAAEAERLRAELAQARADALVLAGLLHFDAAPGLADVSVDALTNAIGAAASLPDTEVLAVIRRALGGT